MNIPCAKRFKQSKLTFTTSLPIESAIANNNTLGLDDNNNSIIDDNSYSINDTCNSNSIDNNNNSVIGVYM